MNALLLLFTTILIHHGFAQDDEGSNSPAAVLLSQYAARLQFLENNSEDNRAEIETLRLTIDALESKLKNSLLEFMRIRDSTTTTTPTPLITFLTTTTTTPTQGPMESTQWNIIGDTKWAFNCDFVGGDIGNQASSGEECGGICWNRGDCTHFTWTNWKGGTCFLKGSGVNLVEVPKYNENAVCGKVRIGNGWNRSGNIQWKFNCDFVGGDITRQWSKGEGCGDLCQNRSGCSHFTWTDWNGGTCFLKGAGVNPVPVPKANENAVCGYLIN